MIVSDNMRACRNILKSNDLTCGYCSLTFVVPFKGGGGLTLVVTMIINKTGMDDYGKFEDETRGVGAG